MNLKNIILSIAGFLIVIILVIQILPEKEVSKLISSPLIAEDAFYDFGTIAIGGGLAETEYTLINEGEDIITIGKVYTSCMCTTALLTDSEGLEKGIFGMPGHGGILSRADSEILPGESVVLKAIYDPMAHGPSGTGLIQRSIFIETDSNETPEIELRLKAMVTK